MKKILSTRGPKPTNLIQTIERVSSILDVLAQSSSGISLGDISAKVHLPKGTTHRLLSSLMYFDFVEQNPETRNYSLGFKLVELGSNLLDQIDFRIPKKSGLFENNIFPLWSKGDFFRAAVELAVKQPSIVELFILVENISLFHSNFVASFCPCGEVRLIEQCQIIEFIL